MLKEVRRVDKSIFLKREEISQQGYKAKALAASMHYEITNKLRIFKRIKKQSETYTYGTLNKIRFMHSRIKEMNLVLERARTNIDIALDLYSQ